LQFPIDHKTKTGPTIPNINSTGALTNDRGRVAVCGSWHKVANYR